MSLEKNKSEQNDNSHVAPEEKKKRKLPWLVKFSQEDTATNLKLK